MEVLLTPISGSKDMIPTIDRFLFYRPQMDVFLYRAKNDILCLNLLIGLGSVYPTRDGSPLILPPPVVS